MKTKNLFLLAALIAGLGLIPAGRVTAQTFTTLHSFTGGSDGDRPYAGLISSGNTLYGTTEFGGSSGLGIVFAVNTDGTGFTNLHSFAGYPTDGSRLFAELILSGNTLYGAASEGGSSGRGTLFKVRTNGTGFTTVYTFTAAGLNPTGYFTNSDGVAPYSRLILSGNTLYGATVQGGSSGWGTVYAVKTNGTGLTNVHTFAAGSGSFPNLTNSEGALPRVGLTLSGNRLYGTAPWGGSSGQGTVFAVNTDGSGFTTLHSFTAISGLSGTNSDGAHPRAGLTLSGNTLYGTAREGGSSGSGTVFALNTNGTGFTILYSFTATNGVAATNSDGASPRAALTLSGNTLYGTASEGGSSGNGTVFAVNTDGTGFTNLYNFTATAGPGPSTNSDGVHPYAGLILTNNTLYGTAIAGGSSGFGTVFSLSLGVDSLLLDGDFNSLALGTAPDVGVPAGHWFFPLDYAGVDEFTNASEMSITVAPGGTNGNSLHVLADATIINNQHLPNIFTQSVSKGTGAWVIATFDLYVATGHGGGSVYLGNGWAASSNRGPQIAWNSTGNMVYTAPDGSRTNLIGSYLQGIWQSVRIEADIDNDRYNFYAGPRGSPFSVTSSNLPFRSGTIPLIDRFTITRFDTHPDADSYYDNIVVQLAPVTAPQLTISRSGANVVLMWPINAVGFNLESTTSPVSPVVWSANPPAPVVVNGQNAVTNPISGPQKFYRLHK